MTQKHLNSTATRYWHMHQRLSQGPVTVAQLAKEVGCTYEAARRWVHALVVAKAVEFHSFGEKKQGGSRGQGIAPSLYRWKQ